MTSIKTPPGTVPLMEHDDEGIHIWGRCAVGDDPCEFYGCLHIGFRVVDEPVFEAWRKEQFG